MGRNFTVLFVHLVWATWDRRPLIAPAWERQLYRVVESEAIGMGCSVVAINGMPDHVHVLLSLSTTTCLATLVKQMKGVSSHWANERRIHPDHFKWQGSYGAFTVSRWDIPTIAEYIHRQKHHHNHGPLTPALERTTDPPTASAKADAWPHGP
jgi:REP element-mobilizing transposase RayT